MACPDFSGIGDKIMPPIPPGESFAAEFTPPRSGTFPYHSHLHEMRQIGSGMYGAIIVSDAPRDTTRDHVIVAGGGGLPVFYKQAPNFLLVNGSTIAAPIRMTVGDTNRLRIVSIHADEVLHFRFGTEAQVARWKPLARDGADLPVALRGTRVGRGQHGSGRDGGLHLCADAAGRHDARGVDRRRTTRRPAGGGARAIGRREALIARHQNDCSYQMPGSSRYGTRFMYSE